MQNTDRHSDLNPYSPPLDVSEAPTGLVTGYAITLRMRVLGVFCLLLFVPLYIWFWQDENRLVLMLRGHISLENLFLAFATLLILWSSAQLGFFSWFDRTTVSDAEIRWGLFIRRRLPIDEIATVIEVKGKPPQIKFITKAGQICQVNDGTEALHQAFLRLQKRLPPASSSNAA
jgi:hypothetical protein